MERRRTTGLGPSLGSAASNAAETWTSLDLPIEHWPIEHWPIDH